jgi:nucleoside-diphosphate-sugar epimerase
MHYTVLGANGFIGSRVMQRLAADGIPHQARGHDILDHLDENLGHLLYCIGLTADFRKRPFDTVDAHVHVLSQILRKGRFESLTYISSTRVYQGNADTRETVPLILDVHDPGDLFNASKLLGESLCLWSGKKEIKIVRLANVVGPRPDTNVFLDQVLQEAFTKGEVVFHTAPESSKDYIHLDDVADALLRIAAEGRHDIYNLAAGANVTNRTISDLLAEKFGVQVYYAPKAPVWAFTPIDISRLRDEFGFQPKPFGEYILDYMTDFRKRLTV